MSIQLYIYRFFIWVAGPLIDLYLLSRRQKGKEDEERFSERLGITKISRPEGIIVWIHAASVGESISVLPLVNLLLESNKNTNILFTTGTVTSAKILQKRLPKRVIHQFVPVDKYITVKRFLEHWKPDIALWVESELWPNLIIESQKSGCKMIQVNARISEDSRRTWQRAKKLIQRMLECFSLSLAQSQQDADRLKELGAKNTKYIGNLKYDAPPLPTDPKEAGQILKAIGERQFWVAASTHKGEEEIIFSIHRKLREKQPDLLTIIIPRHPNRSKEIAEDIRQKDSLINIAIRSEGEEIKKDTEIYIADTMGELGIFYRLANIVFIGGSLVDHGGQNPLEAARLECAIISGPHTHNFSEIYREMKYERAYLEVSDEEELYSTVSRLFSNHEEVLGLARRAQEIVESKQGIVKKYLEEIKPFLNQVGEKKK